MDNLEIETVFSKAVAESYLMVKGEGLGSLYRPWAGFSRNLNESSSKEWESAAMPAAPVAVAS